MATTPPAAKVSNEEYGNLRGLLVGLKCSCSESMQIDPPPLGPGDEADVESEGGTILPKSKSHTPRDAVATPKPEQANGKRNGAPVEIVDDDEGDDDAKEDGDEETFAVEKVLAHRIAKKSNVSASLACPFHQVYADRDQGVKGFQYLIKWLGYDNSNDNTWEDEDNCEGAQQLINLYWEKVGPKPSLTIPNKGGRKRNLSTPASETGATKRRRKSSTEEPTPSSNKVIEVSSWEPPADLDNWDDQVADVETMEKTDNGLILVYLQW